MVRQEASSVDFLHLQEADYCFFFFFTVPRYYTGRLCAGKNVAVGWNQKHHPKSCASGRWTRLGSCLVGGSLSQLQCPEYGKHTADPHLNSDPKAGGDE